MYLPKVMVKDGHADTRNGSFPKPSTKCPAKMAGRSGRKDTRHILCSLFFIFKADRKMGGIREVAV